MNKEEQREIVYKYLMNEINKHPKLRKKYPALFEKGYQEFLHWYDVAQTRSHQLSKKLWAKCNGYEENEQYTGISLNKRIHPTDAYIIAPLISLSNHRQPKKLDLSDFVTFRFDIAELKNSVSKKSQMTLTFSTDIQYD